ncbi:MAG: phage tail protein [Deltaproteobacteria bacterium]|nr:MAG: phage tail protein [Deltaproteobacteria bacterium]
MFAGNFAPRGWAFCDGQLLAIPQHTALFSIVGTLYGGNGTTTFGLPDLRGRFAMHPGSGPGLSARTLGEQGGTETTTLSQMELASHAHALAGLAVSDRLPDPAAPVAGPADTGRLVVSSPGTTTPSIAVAATGGSLPQPNMPPFRAVNYIIATEGIFPSRA